MLGSGRESWPGVLGVAAAETVRWSYSTAFTEVASRLRAASGQGRRDAGFEASGVHFEKGYTEAARFLSDTALSTKSGKPRLQKRSGKQ